MASRSEARQRFRARRGPRLPPFTFEVAGIQRPPVFDAEQATLPDNALVIGVRVGDAVRAYLLRAFEAPGVSLPFVPDGSVVLDDRQAAILARHVVNDVLADRPVTVTYCDRQRCARVLTKPERQTALDVGVGGWDDGMLLTVNGDRVPQRSEAMPLEDVPFEITTWKEWRERFPETDVYVGG